jgi:hypothetical protein
VRFLILASHFHPHFHGTFTLEAGQKSSILIVGWFHSPSRCLSRPPLSSHVSFRLCVAVATIPRMGGGGLHTTFEGLHTTFEVLRRESVAS